MGLLVIAIISCKQNLFSGSAACPIVEPEDFHSKGGILIFQQPWIIFLKKIAPWITLKVHLYAHVHKNGLVFYR